MSVRISSVERQKLNKLHPDLVKVIERAAEISDVRFRVAETTRTVAQQRINIKKKVSKTMNSRHLPRKDGLAMAVDLWVIVPVIKKDGKVKQEPTWAWPPYLELRKIMLKAAKDVKVPIQTLKWDAPHYQLPWRLYP